MKTSDIPDELILKFLSKFQGQWTLFWDLKIDYPTEIPYKILLAKMRKLHKRKLVGGCTCGCRGDFEITDKGLELIGVKRTAPYTGY